MDVKHHAFYVDLTGHEDVDSLPRRVRQKNDFPNVDRRNLLDLDFIILHFAVGSRAIPRQTTRRVQTEPCVGPTGRRVRRNHVRERVNAARRQRLVRENLFARVGPVTVLVEVDPRVEYPVFRRAG